MTDFGVYIHFPWCRKLCPYCDFPVTIARPGRIPFQAYLDRVLRELDTRYGDFAGGHLVSIYFGGGTPSIWPASCLAELIATVKSRFGDEDRCPAGANPGGVVGSTSIKNLRNTANPGTVAEGDPGEELGARRPGSASRLEITLEANPVDCTEANFALWGAAGINRISIGVQSSSPEELVTLGRDHRHGHGIAALAAACSSPLFVVSADVILGVPGGRGLGGSLATVAAQHPEHLSVYELTIEANTHFGKRVRAGTLTPRSPEALASIYMAAHDQLTERGYQHYEISSYAKPGHQSRHNSLYWRGANYLGLGAGAASFRRLASGDCIRRTNIRSSGRYLRSNRHNICAEKIEISNAEARIEAVWLGMRTSDGVEFARFKPNMSALEELLSHGLVDVVDGRVRPTIRGFLFGDQISRAIVGA